VPGDMEAEQARQLSEEELAAIAVAQEEENDLTPRRLAFVREYLKDLNGTQAAIRAGYSKNTAGSIASFLLKDVNVAARIERGIEQRNKRTQYTQDEVLMEMSLLANSSIDHYIVDDDGNLKLAPGAPEGAMGAVKTMKKKVRWTGGKQDEMPEKIVEIELTLWDKPTPLKLMGRHVGIFADRVEHTGKDGGAIETVTRIENVIIDPKVKE